MVEPQPEMVVQKPQKRRGRPPKNAERDKPPVAKENMVGAIKKGYLKDKDDKERDKKDKKQNKYGGASREDDQKNGEC